MQLGRRTKSTEAAGAEPAAQEQLEASQRADELGARIAQLEKQIDAIDRHTASWVFENGAF